MKKFLVICTVVGSLLGFNVAQAQVIDEGAERELISICKALKSNNEGKLRRVIAKSRFNYKSISKGLVCNGMDPVTFALRHNAQETAQLFARKSNMDYESLLAKL